MNFLTFKRARRMVYNVGSEKAKKSTPCKGNDRDLINAESDRIVKI